MPTWTDRFLVLDTETTGADAAQDRVVELGAVLFEAPTLRVLLDERVNPQRPIPPEASRIHRINDEDVRDKQPFAEIAPILVAHLRGHGYAAPPVLVGYNAAAFDVPLLNLEFQRAAVPHLIDPAQVIDVLTFVRWHLRHHKDRKLSVMCRTFGVQLAQAHSASADAVAAGQLLESGASLGAPSPDRAIPPNRVGSLEVVSLCGPRRSSPPADWIWQALWTAHG